MRTYLLAVLLITPTLALADNLEEAKAAFASGKQAFERGDYETALSQFQRANLLAPAPSLSYNIGKTYEALGKYHDAALAFERYLELAGPPQTDEDRTFQDNLKARIDADKARPDTQAPSPAQPTPQPQAAPPPPPPPPPQQYQYPPYYYQQPVPYQAPLVSRQVRLDQARSRRGKAIAGFAVGAVFLVAGLALVGDGVTSNHGGPKGDTGSGSCSGSSDPTSCLGNDVELVFGVIFSIIGVILVPVEIPPWVKAQAEINKLSRPEQGQAFLPAQPLTNLSATTFKLPALRF